MLFRATALALFGASALSLAPAIAQDSAPPAPAPSPAPSAMPATTIADAIATAPNLSTLAAALKATDLSATLAGPGPYTVFAPDNDAFGRLGAQVAQLMQPQNKALLARILGYHVVPGALDAQALLKQVQAGGGKTVLTTMEGEPLTVTLEKVQGNDALVLSDVEGNKAYPLKFDLKQSNGVVHVINGVLLPSQKVPAPSPSPAPGGDVR